MALLSRLRVEPARGDRRRARALVLLAVLATSTAAIVAQEDPPPTSLTLRFTNEELPLEREDLAKFYIYEPGDREQYVAWGHGAKTAHFPAGVYDLVIRFEDGAARRTIVREQVELSGDAEEEIELGVPVGHLTLEVTSGGIQVEPFAAKVAVYPVGNRDRPVAEKRPGERIGLRKGSYDIAVYHRSREGMKSSWLEGYPVEGEQFETVEMGARRVVLGVTLTRDGDPLSATAAAWRVYRPGQRRAYLAERGSGESVQLEAGRYDIGAFYRNSERGAERWVTDLELVGSETRRIELGREAARTATVELVVTRDGAPTEDGWCSVYALGDRSAQLASAASGERVRLAPGTYDIGCYLEQSGGRAERWLDSRSVSADERIEVELTLRTAYLRVLPRVTRRTNRGQPRRIHILLDSSSGMDARSRAGTRLEEAARALRASIESLSAPDVEIGLRIVGGHPPGPRCLTSSLLASPGSPARLAAPLGQLAAGGQAALAHALQLAAGDLPPGDGNFLVLIGGNPDECGADPCSAAASLVRDGAVDRVYVLGFRVDRSRRRDLGCVGDYTAVDDAQQLQAALEAIVRDTARWNEGVLAILTPESPGRWVAGGFLGDKIEVVEGNYDVLIRSRGKDYLWRGLRIEGNVQGVAGRRAPR